MRRFRELLPSADQVRQNRWLRWLGPALHDPRLWHLSRRGLAMGMALGLFFGLLVPLAQIPLSAGAAVVLRANVPAAVVSTLVTNPVTFAPIYYGAWRVGSAMLGEHVGPTPPSLAKGEQPELEIDEGWVRNTVRRLLNVGKPLLLGLAVLATGAGLATYLLVSAAWRITVLAKRRRRLARARGGAGHEHVEP